MRIFTKSSQGVKIMVKRIIGLALVLLVVFSIVMVVRNYALSQKNTSAKIQMLQKKLDKASAKHSEENEFSFLTVSNESTDRTSIELYREFWNRGMKPVKVGEADVNINEYQSPKPFIIIKDANGGVIFNEFIGTDSYRSQMNRLVTNLRNEKTRRLRSIEAEKKKLKC